MRHHVLLDEYRAAIAKVDETNRMANRALRRWDKLEKRGVDERRAFDVSGLKLADKRWLAAGRARDQALDRLINYALRLDDVEQLMVIGAAMCAGKKWWAAND